MNEWQLKEAIEISDKLEKQTSDGKLKRVASDEFYKKIGKLDVTVTATGNYPHKADFAYRNGVKVGYEHMCKYYLCV